MGVAALTENGRVWEKSVYTRAALSASAICAPQNAVAAQDAMRKRWLIDQLYSDPYASSIVPYKAWFMANVPPVIKF